jgi:hypothetical protein
MRIAVVAELAILNRRYAIPLAGLSGAFSDGRFVVQ